MELSSSTIRFVYSDVKETVTQTLKCALSKDELLACGQKAADAQQRLAEANNELEVYKQQYKAKVAEQEGVIAWNTTLIRDKYELRPIECEVIKNYETETYSVVRKDAWETIEERPMTKDELSQLAIGDAAGAEPKPKG